MVDYAHSGLFTKGSVDKQWKIEYSNGVIRNARELASQSIELEESICSETNLRFGCCEASILKFKVANILTPLIGEQLKVSVILEHHDSEPFAVGSYKVASDKPTADRRYRDVVAYDAMYDILNTDMAAWYNEILPNEDSRVTLRQFRASFMQHFGLEEEEADLVNDDMTVERTVQPEQMSGKDVITAICEINGCFGHITRDGKFRYVILPRFIQGLYPRNDLYPANDLYPRDPRSERIGKGVYISCKYEDYQVKAIDKVQIRQEENDIGAIYPDTEIDENDNCYIVQGNFLVYGKGHEELSEIASRLLGVISGIVYRPFEAECMGNLCLEVGDAVRLSTKYELIESYILQRRMKGLQSLRDIYIAEGDEKQKENVNGVQTSIMQLKGKTNILTRTVEETRLEMKDLGEGLSAEISITAGQIRTELNDTKTGLETEISITAKGLEAKMADTQNGLQTQITANANGLSAEITRAKGEEGKLSNSIKVTADGLDAEITRASGVEGSLSTRITTTADGLSAEITRAKGAEGNLSTSISAVAGEVKLKVSKDNLITEINASAESATIKSSKINLNGYTSINGNFNIDTSGNLTIGQDNSSSKIYLGGSTLRLRDTSTGHICAITPDEMSFTSGLSGSGWTKIIYAASGEGYVGQFDAIKTKKISSTSKITFEGLTEFSSNTSFSGGMSVASNMSVGGTIEAKSHADIEGDLTVWQDCDIEGKLYMGGDIQLSDGSLLSSKLGAYQTASNAHSSVYLNSSFRIYYSGSTLYFGDSTNSSNYISFRPGTVQFPNISSSSSEANAVLDGSSGSIKKSTASSMRYKNRIAEVREEALAPERLYDIPVVQYRYNTDYLKDPSDRRYDRDVIGFIAEDIAGIYPVAAEYDEYGRPDNWNARYMIPPMLALIQKLNKEIQEIKSMMEEKRC